MCKMCAVSQASIIDNMQADTSLKLANAAAVLFSAARNKEGDELVQAALDYWKVPKDDAASDLLKQESQARAQADQTSNQTCSNTGQAEARPSLQTVQVAVRADGSYVTQGPVPSQGFHLDRDNGELYIDGVYIGVLALANTPFGKSILLKRAGQ